jgi:hypothetical protein
MSDEDDDDDDELIFVKEPFNHRADYWVQVAPVITGIREYVKFYYRWWKLTDVSQIKESFLQDLQTLLDTVDIRFPLEEIVRQAKIEMDVDKESRLPLEEWPR